MWKPSSKASLAGTLVAAAQRPRVCEHGERRAGDEPCKNSVTANNTQLGTEHRWRTRMVPAGGTSR